MTDIEGTTSALSFVKDVLFPYAALHLPDFIRTHRKAPELEALLQEVSEIEGRVLTEDELITVLLGWIAEDKKLSPLKALQGMIWAEGYRTKKFCGHVYPDVPGVLRRWKAANLALYVFSSGSVDAQKLLFGHTEAGDLNEVFSGYFDTRTGPKKEAHAYTLIAQAIGLDPAEILFLSDVGAELDAARDAGMQTTQILRAGVIPVSGHPQVEHFDQIDILR